MIIKQAVLERSNTVVSKIHRASDRLVNPPHSLFMPRSSLCNPKVVGRILDYKTDYLFEVRAPLLNNTEPKIHRSELITVEHLFFQRLHAKACARQEPALLQHRCASSKLRPSLRVYAICLMRLLL